ncbi:hypothetical protein C8R47DRAFT_1064205 [Mycena vitilis]|nr:hypothetical protein C8R47DRAFT_1064205 [Mycena vitilis]
MVATEWTSLEQRAFLHSEVPLLHQGARKFQKTWFQRWSEAQHLHLVRGPNDAPWTKAQAKLLGEETAKTQERLKSWLRYREKKHRLAAAADGGAASNNNNNNDFFGKRSLFRMLNKVTTRPFGVVEIYQKMFGANIKKEVMNLGYGELNEEAVERARVAAAEAAAEATGDESVVEPVVVMVLNEAETKSAEMREDNLVIARIRGHRSARMKLWRKASSAMLEAESTEVKELVVAKTAQLNDERMLWTTKTVRQSNTSNNSNTTDSGIDQLGHVYAKVHEATMAETGWFGVTILGGPMPRRAGAISTKTICFGSTALGSDFQAFNPNFEQVKTELCRFLKRAFPHEVRDARGIVPEGDDAPDGTPDDLNDLNDLLVLDPVPDEEELAAMKPPKRIRRKPVAAASPIDEDEPTPTFAAAEPSGPHQDVPFDLPDLVAVPEDDEDDVGANFLPYDPTFTVPESDSSVYDDAASSVYGLDGTGSLWSDDPAAFPFDGMDMDGRGYAADAGNDIGLTLPPLILPPVDDAAPQCDATASLPVADSDVLMYLPVAEYAPQLDARNDSLAVATSAEPAAVRPSARPIHKGGPFERNRDMGSLEFHAFPRPSAYFQAFVKPPTTAPTPSSVGPVATITMPPAATPPAAGTLGTGRNRPSAVEAFSAIVAGASGVRGALPAVGPPPLPTAAPQRPPAVGPPPLPTAAAHPAVGLPPLPAAVPRRRPAVGPIAVAAVGSPALPAAGPQAARLPVVGQPAVELAPVVVPQYPQSRPWIKPPVGHPLAPTKKKSNAVLGKKAKKAKAALVKAARVAKTADTKAKKAAAAAAALAASANADPALAASAIADASGPLSNGEETVVPRTMTAAARAETNRLKAIEAGHRKVREEMLRREKGIDKAETARKAAELAEKKRLHNPAGGADLFHTGSRPKRHPISRINFDNTVMPTQNKRKRGADTLAAGDALLLGRFAKQKEAALALETAGPSTKKRLDDDEFIDLCVWNFGVTRYGKSEWETSHIQVDNTLNEKARFRGFIVRGDERPNPKKKIDSEFFVLENQLALKVVGGPTETGTAAGTRGDGTGRERCVILPWFGLAMWCGLAAAGREGREGANKRRDGRAGTERTATVGGEGTGAVHGNVKWAAASYWMAAGTEGGEQEAVMYIDVASCMRVVWAWGWNQRRAGTAGPARSRSEQGAEGREERAFNDNTSKQMIPRHSAPELGNLPSATEASVDGFKPSKPEMKPDIQPFRARRACTATRQRATGSSEREQRGVISEPKRGISEKFPKSYACEKCGETFEIVLRAVGSGRCELLQTIEVTATNCPSLLEEQRAIWPDCAEPETDASSVGPNLLEWQGTVTKSAFLFVSVDSLSTAARVTCTTAFIEGRSTETVRLELRNHKRKKIIWARVEDLRAQEIEFTALSIKNAAASKWIEWPKGSQLSLDISTEKGTEHLRKQTIRTQPAGSRTPDVASKEGFNATGYTLPLAQDLMQRAIESVHKDTGRL